ncbi:hypothetical protein AYJ05_04735 [Corynebacterium stationis]|uniref:Uncharacterized protein n=1 Tax=Corynebacterium stationis TaxID=1705 RepID=A0A177IEE3_9CORY|nr:hypothetical protein AYJ05_04735 [Corynebacterium stationis]
MKSRGVVAPTRTVLIVETTANLVVVTVVSGTTNARTVRVEVTGSLVVKMIEVAAVMDVRVLPAATGVKIVMTVTNVVVEETVEKAAVGTGSPVENAVGITVITDVAIAAMMSVVVTPVVEDTQTVEAVQSKSALVAT